jgi:hypothetical protein
MSSRFFFKADPRIGRSILSRGVPESQRPPNSQRPTPGAAPLERLTESTFKRLFYIGSLTARNRLAASQRHRLKGAPIREVHFRPERAQRAPNKDKGDRDDVEADT